MTAFRRFACLASCSFVLGSVAGCGGGSAKTTPGTLEDGGGDTAFVLDGGDDGPTFVTETLAISPTNATIYIDTATSPATQGKVSFVGTLTHADGTTEDVTQQLTFTIDDNSMGSFSGPDFTSAPSLPTNTLVATSLVHAAGAGKTALANLTVVQLRKTGQQRDFYFVIPYMQPPQPPKDVLGFSTDIKKVDVAFVVDTTGSMGPDINNFKSNLSKSGGIIDSIAKAIPDVGIAVVYHDDYPYGGYGVSGSGHVLPGDLPVGVVQAITTNISDAQTAANKLEVHNGVDEPESQIPAMYYTLTGNTLSWPGGSVAAHTPATGMRGGVDFRPGAVPVIVEVTDSWMHNGKGGANAYSFGGPSYNDLITAFTSNHARYVGVSDIGTADSGHGAEAAKDNISDDTGSSLPTSAFGTSGQCPTGLNGALRAPSGPGGTCRLDFLISAGNGLGGSVATAISAIAVGSTFDISAVVSNDPANAGGVDATKFINAIRAMDEGDAAEGCAPQTGKVKDTNGDGIADTFIGITASKNNRVCFEVQAKMNDVVPAQNVAQIFRAFIDVVGMPGAVNLGDRREALFLVPPKDVTAQ